jgi:hypothetical protein
MVGPLIEQTGSVHGDSYDTQTQINMVFVISEDAEEKSVSDLIENILEDVNRDDINIIYA